MDFILSSIQKTDRVSGVQHCALTSSSVQKFTFSMFPSANQMNAASKLSVEPIILTLGLITRPRFRNIKSVFTHSLHIQ